MNNITYLFGAGASYNACPILNELGDRMMELSKVLGYKFSYSEENPSHSSIMKEIAWRIGYFGYLSKDFNTIDTYAKKLYLLEDRVNELGKLKSAISLFFTIWSLTNNENWRLLKNANGKARIQDLDPRYINLLATFLERGEHNPVLNNNVKFVTWNYDLQLEEAYRRFTLIEKDNYQSIDKHFPFIPSTVNKDKIVVCHLNGFHGFYGFQEGYNLFQRTDKRDLHSLLVTISDVVGEKILKLNSFAPFINYAWEQESEIAKIARERAKKIFSETTTLVVIGYSFPPFNYSIDKQLFISAKNSLRKIIIQDPIVDENFIAETFDIDRKMISVVRDVKQFVIPNFTYNSQLPII